MRARSLLLAAATVCAIGVVRWQWSRTPLGATEQNCATSGACEAPRTAEQAAAAERGTVSEQTVAAESVETTPKRPDGAAVPAAETADEVAPTAAPGSPQAGLAPPPYSKASESEVSANSAHLREAAKYYLGQGQIAPAVDALREAVEADPNNADNQGDLGGLLVKVTAFDDGLVHLRRAAYLDPNNADRWIALANGYYMKVDPGEAWKAERRAREVESGLVLGWGSDGLRIRVGGEPIVQP